MRVLRALRLAVPVGLILTLLPLSLLLAEDSREVTVEGRVQCVSPDFKPVACSDNSRNFALKTDDGSLYFFTSKDPRSKIFQDSRVRQRRLRVVGWLGEKNVIEITKVYSVKNGQLYNIYYYCPICNIKAYAGGPCWCCQEEFEFHEDPVKP